MHVKDFQKRNRWPHPIQFRIDARVQHLEVIVVVPSQWVAWSLKHNMHTLELVNQSQIKTYPHLKA
jgi:hypothetical protein